MSSDEVPRPVDPQVRIGHVHLKVAELKGIGVGRRVSVFKLDSVTGERLNLIASTTAGEGGWVDLTELILVRAGEGFVAVPDQGT